MRREIGIRSVEKFVAFTGVENFGVSVDDFLEKFRENARLPLFEILLEAIPGRRPLLRHANGTDVKHPVLVLDRDSVSPVRHWIETLIRSLPGSKNCFQVRFAQCEGADIINALDFSLSWGFGDARAETNNLREFHS